MGMIKTAYDLAKRVHEGQVDKAGDPYIRHPVRVAAMVEGEDAKTVAILHDVVEDTPVTFNQLLMSFPVRIVEGVDAVTKRDDEGETYMESIKRAMKDPLGLVVKTADVQDHLRPGYEDVITEAMIQKYKKALKLLLIKAP